MRGAFPSEGVPEGTSSPPPLLFSNFYLGLE